MSIRDGIFTTVAVAISGVALAGLLGTDAYSSAAGAEARGFHALAAQVKMVCGECDQAKDGLARLDAQEAGQ
jgi:hypothetical protein